MVMDIRERRKRERGGKGGREREKGTEKVDRPVTKMTSGDDLHGRDAINAPGQRTRNQFSHETIGLSLLLVVKSLL